MAGKGGSQYELVLNPQEGVNDTDALLLDWRVQDGEAVEPGQVLCEMQTAKAAYDVTAPSAGLVQTVARVGEKVGVNHELAAIFRTEEAFAREGESLRTSLRAKHAPVKIQITEKARKLAESLGIAAEQITTGSGIVREKDVREFHAQQTTRGAPASGVMKPEFIRQLREDISFRSLSSERKVELYRANGAVIGEGVSFAAGAGIIANSIEIGDGTSFHENAWVVADTFRIGKLGVVGPRADIVTRTVWIGDVFFSGNGIIIGGGGAFGSNSEFRCGDNCLVSSQCIINTTEAVVFGDEVGLSPRVQIYTHSHWQDVFEGYPASYGPVSIGSHTYITGSAMIVPGVTVGFGCTVLANSVVTSDVKDRDVVAGVPAAVVGHVEGGLTVEKKNRIMQRLLPQLKERLAEIQLDPEGFSYAPKYAGAADRPVLLTFQWEGGDPPEGTTVFDFGNKEIIGPQGRYTDEIRNFFRKRGVRFKPHVWRYVHDAGLFNQ